MSYSFGIIVMAAAKMISFVYCVMIVIDLWMDCLMILIFLDSELFMSALEFSPKRFNLI